MAPCLHRANGIRGASRDASRGWDSRLCAGRRACERRGGSHAVDGEHFRQVFQQTRRSVRVFGLQPRRRAFVPGNAVFGPRRLIGRAHASEQQQPAQLAAGLPRHALERGFRVVFISDTGSAGGSAPRGHRTHGTGHSRRLLWRIMSSPVFLISCYVSFGGFCYRGFASANPIFPVSPKEPATSRPSTTDGTPP